MKQLIRILDSSGDSRFEFDLEDQTVDGHRMNTAAREAFEHAMSAGGQAFNLKPEGDSEKIKRFDQVGDETVVVPRIVGG